jgi:hypothetical protein
MRGREYLALKSLGERLREEYDPEDLAAWGIFDGPDGGEHEGTRQ